MYELATGRDGRTGYFIDGHPMEPNVNVIHYTIFLQLFGMAIVRQIPGIHFNDFHYMIWKKFRFTLYPEDCLDEVDKATVNNNSAPLDELVRDPNPAINMVTYEDASYCITVAKRLYNKGHRTAEAFYYTNEGQREINIIRMKMLDEMMSIMSNSIYKPKRKND